MYTIGLDFGTLSVRAMLVNVENGRILAMSASPYSHGVIDRVLPNGRFKLKEDWALQHPQDWLDSMIQVMQDVLAHIPDPAQLIGIGIDFTACTVLPVTADGTPLCQQEKWQDAPHAWPKLWKHHAAQKQASHITATAIARDEQWLARYGGIISSEWLLPKGLQILEEDPDLYADMALLIEGADWIVWQLTGQFARNSCAAGFKGLWHKADGYPEADYLEAVHPDFADFYKTKGRGETAVSGTTIGTLTTPWAEKLGLPATIAVGAGIIDAHAGAIGAGVTDSGTLYMAMGTSTCHLLLADHESLCEGISGVVEDGILPGKFGYEAGQAAVGDIFNWFTTYSNQSHEALTVKASQLQPGESGLLALDWWNGCRTPLVDADLSGIIMGYSLQTQPHAVYRALIEATAFGTRLILDTFAAGDTPVHTLRVSGGLTKNEMLLQIYADVTGLPLEVCATEQSSALGAAILGATAGNAYASIKTAAQAMVPPPSRIIQPNPQQFTVYSALYDEYKRLVTLFGRDMASSLKKLRALQESSLWQR